MRELLATQDGVAMRGLHANQDGVTMGELLEADRAH